MQSKTQEVMLAELARVSILKADVSLVCALHRNHLRFRETQVAKILEMLILVCAAGRVNDAGEIGSLFHDAMSDRHGVGGVAEANFVP